MQRAPVGQNSVVQFSTTASRVSRLSSSSVVIPLVNELDYKGGLTNHAEALERCREAFLGTRDPNMRNVILLVTDGVAAWPRGNPFGEAHSAPVLVKNEGTYIRPVFIDGQNQQQLDYMSSLSSNGEVSEGNSFGELPALNKNLLPEILCEDEAPTRKPTISNAPSNMRTRSFCGCVSCMQEIWDTFATGSAGNLSYGDRITWLVTVQGYDETSACTKVSNEFIDGPCGPFCDPFKCRLSGQPSTVKYAQ